MIKCKKKETVEAIKEIEKFIIDNKLGSDSMVYRAMEKLTEKLINIK